MLGFVSFIVRVKIDFKVIVSFTVRVKFRVDVWDIFFFYSKC